MSDWSGSLGDALDVAEVMRGEEEWLARTSRFLVPMSDPDIEDIAQEGRIAIWKAMQRYDPTKGPMGMWVKANARWRMKDVRRDRTWTGRPDDARATLGGHQSRVHELTYLSDLLDDTPSVAHMLEAADLLDAAEWAYHHGEIALAMTALSPRQREYVYLRFWLGYEQPQLRDVFKMADPGSSLWRSPQGARSRLRVRLAHLAVQD